MNAKKIFGEVDQYLEQLFIGDDPVLDRVLANSAAAGMPAIHVSPLQGKFLMIMAQLIGAKRVLELGTLAGYSTIWLARGVGEDGHVTTLEANADQAKLAEQHFALAGVADRVTCIQGLALRTLPGLEGQPLFDMVFIDADKPNYIAYLDWALKLTRPGGLIIADNVVRRGHVLDPSKSPSEEERSAAQAVRDFNARIAAEPRLTTIALQQVGAKSHDGFAMARVKLDGE